MQAAGRRSHEAATLKAECGNEQRSWTDCQPASCSGSIKRRASAPWLVPRCDFINERFFLFVETGVSGRDTIGCKFAPGVAPLKSQFASQMKERTEERMMGNDRVGWVTSG